MRRRRAIVVFVVGAGALLLLAGLLPGAIQGSWPEDTQGVVLQGGSRQEGAPISPATEALKQLPVKGRAPTTGYERDQFGHGWSEVNGCSTRNIILYRDLQNTVLDEACIVISGVLHDPYSGELVEFTKEESSMVQIDHVVALSDAWQKGAQNLTRERRIQLANDPLELLAVKGADNQAKGGGDAATWLPANKSFRCEYVARQIAVKTKYTLWVTPAEKEAMAHVLTTCPGQKLP